MRKLILILAFVSASILASASAQAGAARNLTLAAHDEPAAVETAKPDETSARPEASTQPASRPANTRIVRRESDMQKARRIAARYGVYW
jgi:hypothetical protein